MRPSWRQPSMRAMTAEPRLAILRALLLVQAGTFVAGIVEGLVFGFVLGPTAVTGAALGVVATVALLAARARVPGRRATRLLVALEALVIAGWTLELVVGIVLAGVLPTAMAWLARLLLPAAAIALARPLAREAAAHAASPGPLLPPPPPAPRRWVKA